MRERFDGDAALGLLLGRLGSGLHLLLVRPHLLQRTRVDDVGHRHVRSRLAVVSRRLPPALWRHAVLLAQQRQEDLAPSGRRSRATPSTAKAPRRRRGRPRSTPRRRRRRSRSTMICDSAWMRLRHRSRKAMDRRSFRAQRERTCPGRIRRSHGHRRRPSGRRSSSGPRTPPRSGSAGRAACRRVVRTGWTRAERRPRDLGPAGGWAPDEFRASRTESVSARTGADPRRDADV